MKEKYNYVYPKLLASYDLSFIRLGGSGLANCMFIAARAWILSKEKGYQFIDPTWNKFSSGPILRRERDKRMYNKLFVSKGIHGLKKMMLLLRYVNSDKQNKVLVVKGIDPYFEALHNHEQEVINYFKSITEPYILKAINDYDFSNTVGVHIRLGDYPEIWRTDLDWYMERIKQLQGHSKNELKFLIFSDGTDDELKDIVNMSNVTKAFFGNALGDIWALSQCKFVIGSDSTFSGWGIFLGQVPCVLAHKFYGPILKDNSKECIIENKNEIPAKLETLISQL